MAALTIASFYIPMALSLSSNLAHAPPINGLYSFVINPFFYAIMGSSSQLIVGPEAAGSLLVGTVVKATVESGHSSETDDAIHAQVVGIVTGLAGAFIFIAGLTRLGFLDNVLSRPFLRGFITAIGVVIFVDQLIPEMGLYDRASAVNHSSTVEKILFILENGEYAHKLTTVVAFSSFAIIMIFRLVFLSFRSINMLIHSVELLKRRSSLVSPRSYIFQIVYWLSFCRPFSPGILVGISKDSKF